MSKRAVSGRALEYGGMDVSNAEKLSEIEDVLHRADSQGPRSLRRRRASTPVRGNVE
jgi:hypothetical protein